MQKHYDLLVVGVGSGDTCCESGATLQSLLNVVTEGGFLLVFEEEDKEVAVADESHLNDFQCKLIAKFHTAIGCYSLIRKVCMRFYARKPISSYGVLRVSKAPLLYGYFGFSRRRPSGKLR